MGKKSLWAVSGVAIPRAEEIFRYLALIIEEKGDINEDIDQRIRVGCGKKIPVGLKGKVYRMIVRPTLLYGSECWPIKKHQVQRLMMAEMRMIRWMCGYTRLDRIRNEVIREKVGVAPIEDKMREARLRWFGHVNGRSENALVRSCETIGLLRCRGGRGRLKKSWNEVIRNDLKFIGITEDMTQDRSLWRSKIKVADHR